MTSNYPKATRVDNDNYIPEGFVVGIGPEISAPPTMNRSFRLSQSSQLPISPIEEANTRAYLTSKLWPVGLQTFLMKNLARLPYRFFICDDSGSMATNDGKLLIRSGNHMKVVKCSRWTEMVEALKFHANLASYLNTPTEFRLLNSASPIVIGGPESSSENLPIFMSILEESPGILVL
jgi:hypothetical protein